MKLRKRWPTARVNFAFFNCPICGEEIEHNLLRKETATIRMVRGGLENRYMERLRLEGLLHCAALTEPSSPYFEQPMAYARDKLNYYMCSMCDKPYFGGLRECQNIDREEPNRHELICGGCSAGSAICERHGNQFMEWKCKYCCNTAVWFCWGTTHFCEVCHNPPRKTVREECPGEELCPLKGKHQPNGAEFAIGCAFCRLQEISRLEK
jgi:E3 ubiquitin-protein ligase MYCBP2